MFMFKKVPSVEWSDLKKGDLIIDVRSEDEFKMGSAKGSINIPLETVENYESDQKVYVMCRSGARSKAAVNILRKKKIDAININGGYLAYEA